MESPEVLFIDVVKVIHEGIVSMHPIDRLFLEACEPGSIFVMSAVPRRPVLIAAEVCGDNLGVISDNEESVGVTVVLSGTRKGASGRRFQEHTEEEARRNASFWDTWRRK
jgi:hypothetical protein